MKVTARLREAAHAARRRGLSVALQTLLLGADRFRALDLLTSIEPMLLAPTDPATVSATERNFIRPSDVYAHLPTLYKTTLDRRLARVLELGTRTGESTVALLQAVQEIGGHVTSIDVEPCPEAEARVADAGLSDRWTFLQADDLAVPWEEPIDHLFIDTSHTILHTRRELEKYEPLVVPGGVITLHDVVSRPDVWRAIRAHFRDRRDVRIFRYFHNNGLALIEKS